MTDTAPQYAPGELYGCPGLTLLTEQPDTNNGIAQTLSQSAQVAVQGLNRFNQTDVVFWWEMEVVWANTVTLAGGTLSTSAYFPYNIVAESRLKVQNQYDSWHVISGIDAAIFQAMRPMRKTDRRNNMDTNPSLTWPTTNVPQSNLNSASAITSATTSITFTLELPASIFFDSYFDLGADGSMSGPPHMAIVSPQYMAGAARVVQPQLNLASGYGTALDASPFAIATGAPTYAGSVTFGFRRVGVYSENDPAVLPVVYSWQYQRDCTVRSLAGVSRIDIPVPTNGQILGLYVRMWDPAAASGVGAPISISTVTVCQVLFGSGLKRYDDTPKSAQRRFLHLHGFLPPQGVIVWDMATDELGRRTNAYALNTLTTSGVTVHLEFSPALSSTAYCVLGTDALVYTI